MTITLELPPAMAKEAQEYATVRGMTLERMLFDCLKAELTDRKCQTGAAFLADYVGCIEPKRRTDDVVAEMRGYDQW